MMAATPSSSAIPAIRDIRIKKFSRNGKMQESRDSHKKWKEASSKKRRRLPTLVDARWGYKLRDAVL